MRLASLPLAAAGRRVPHDHAGGEWRAMARRTHLYLATNRDPALQVQLRALLGESPGPARLAPLRMPLLIVHGARDQMVPVSRARALAATLPHARLAIFPTAHHCPMDTDPPAFAQALAGASAAGHPAREARHLPPTARPAGRGSRLRPG